MDGRESPRLGASRAAGMILRGWWNRLRGRLMPSPCPFELAGALEMPGRRLVASPERILGRFGISAGERVVEIGPGTGFYSVEAARRVGRSGRLICADVQLEMLVESRRRLQAQGLSADFVQADARALPLRSGTIDHVYLIGVLGEIPECSRALGEMRRLLRPGGRLSVSEQLPDPDFVTRRALRLLLSSAGFAEEATRGRLFYTSTWRRLGPHGSDLSLGTAT